MPEAGEIVGHHEPHAAEPAAVPVGSSSVTNVNRDLDPILSWLKSVKPRLDVTDGELLELFWQAHPRFQFFSSLAWGANLIDIGAGGGGLAHWKKWIKPARSDLNLYGVDRTTGEHRALYAGWEAIDLDDEMPSFPGIELNAFYTTHLIEHLAAPQSLIKWLSDRAPPGARIYVEWPSPSTIALPRRDELIRHGVDVVISNFADDLTHRETLDLPLVLRWLAEAGLEVVSSGAIDLGILGEELFARASDRDTRSMGYWSMMQFSLFAVAVKPGQPADVDSGAPTVRRTPMPLGTQTPAPEEPTETSNDRLVRWLKSRQQRLAVREEDLVELFWRVHPRFQFLKSLPWGWNVLDIGAGNGGLAHWRGWLKPERGDLALYGVDREPGEFRELYAGWETIDLDRGVPSFAGRRFNGFIASHLIEYLGMPETLIGWLGERAEPGARLYIEWTGPSSLDLPTREQLQKHGIEVMTSNFIDDWEHKQAPDLERMENWLADAGFNVMASGTIDLGILGEELFARAADRAVRSMGYWSLTRSSLYTVAVKSSEAVTSKRAARISSAERPVVQVKKRAAPEAAPSAASSRTKMRFDASALSVPDPDLRRFAFSTSRALAPRSRQYDPGSLEIHWVIPDFCPGAGGHMNIFRICNRLEASGHRLTLWIRDPQFHDDPDAAKATLNRHFQPLAATVRFADTGLSEAAGDIIVATDAWTVPLVFSAWQFKRRFYFVQDFEPAFVPMGARYLAAEATYRRDLDCICGGPWLEQLMRDHYGRWARKFWQAADPTVYYPSERSEEIGRTRRIAFYFRGFTERRAVELGLLALELLARRGIQFHVDFFGQHELPFAAVPYPATNHGICDDVTLAQLYQTATIGVVFSATNYSIVPQEMMACGLPVVDLDVESTRATYDLGAVKLAAPDPQAIAEAIEAMLADPMARQAQVERALSWVNEFSWGQSANLVETAFRDRLAELGFIAAAPTINRSKETFATVVIPTLDGGDLLRNVIDSVLAQRLPGPLQLICIDSSSTDGTAEYLAAHPNVKLITIDRADFQHGRTRNLGADAAAGEFVAFLTQDALPVDDCWLYNLVCCLINHPNAGGVFGRHIAYPTASEFIKQDLIRHFAGFDDLPVCVSLEDSKIRDMFAETSGRQRLHFYSDNNSALRKSVWQAIRFPEVEFGEDQLFALELLKQGHGKAYSRHGVVYHSHDDAPDIVERRAYIEAKFYYERFGYRLLHSEAHAEQSLVGLNAADQRLARERALPTQPLARRLAQNAARVDGYRRAMREYQPI